MTNKATKIEWTNLGDDRWHAKVGFMDLYAGQNGDGSFYWRAGDKWGCSEPMFNYDGISNPAAYVNAAVENCKRKAESAIA